MPRSDLAVEVSGLTKSFGHVRALAGIDMQVPRGTILGLLGPNGAGKTTAVRILTTLLKPDSGTALVEGYDLVKSPEKVREVIGLTGQAMAVRDELTGTENLMMVGRLFHLPRKSLSRRADELLAQFDLSDAANRTAKTYSGGMRRRLDLAASLIASPSVLFLDEPTTGLDPRSRIGMWQVIKDLVSAGTSVLLTTQYLEEADELADDIVVIDHGTVIASGTASELKDLVGGDVIEFIVPQAEARSLALEAVSHLGTHEPTVDPDTHKITVRVGTQGSNALVEAVRLLDGSHVPIEELALRRPSLDDVFLALTGHEAEDLTSTPKGSREAATK